MNISLTDAVVTTTTTITTSANLKTWANKHMQTHPSGFVLYVEFAKQFALYKKNQTWLLFFKKLSMSISRAMCIDYIIAKYTSF